MSSLQVRELPEPIYRKLAEIAHKEHRSISQQAVILLAKSMNCEPTNNSRRKKILAAIKEQAGELQKYPLKDPVEIIRAERDR